MKIYNCKQNTDEWEEIKKGKITASTFGNLITPTLSIAKSITAKETICEIIGKAICIHDSDDIQTFAMARGNECEPRARTFYTYLTDNKVKEVGFIESDCGNYGFSPDGLIGENGMMEIKTQCKKKHIFCDKYGFSEWLKKYKGQILLPMITKPNIEWCDCISYNEDFKDDDKLYVYRYHRNEEEIEKAKLVLDYWVEELKKYK